MRQLSEQELDQVKRAIAAKELTSAEILMEVYDHYVSHLESYGDSEFEGELFELEQKFTHHYCKALQEKHYNSTHRGMRVLQWKIFKSQLSWPNFIVTATLFSLISYLWTTIDGRTRTVVILVPLGIILLLVVWILIKSTVKVRSIKKTLGVSNYIQSDYLKIILGQWTLILSTLTLGVLAPKNLGFTDPFTNPYYTYITFFLAILYLGYFLTLLQAWKIKSKTALI
ncbi:hypothetical protein SAMN04489724_2947 [Algoriphagus locisalis]|uniref:Uncharacterized protein n=1 Tax=Algoriphagus locisalis TaxID=305507 RepID=A0A1I7C810_9BACT|nr:hypothetical protein [Algoriphagus locisalis]SFT95548.1 hypothetical protein SAMN04489724_2947 [Algoriphagus locisalis]